MAAEIQGLNQLNVTLGEMLSRVGNMRSVLTEVAQKQVGSFQENFYQGGRPKWEPSQRVKKEGGRTLHKRGFLQQSIKVPNITDTSIEYGSDQPYAAIHQFGGTIERKPQILLFRTTRTGQSRFMKHNVASERKRGSIGYAKTGSYTIKISARPYIVFQEKDIEMTGKILLGHLLGNR